VQVLLLLEEHPMEELESAVKDALGRASPSLETIRMLLRQRSSVMPVLAPAPLARPELAAIDVAPAELAGYDELLGGGR
jgi:hypothetical protein